MLITHSCLVRAPLDLEEYQYWSSAFQALIKENQVCKHSGAVIMPMVGLGSKFDEEGYLTPKPLIKVMDKPMAVTALADLPKADNSVFVIRQDLPKLNKLKVALKKQQQECDFVILEQMTDGQATSCMKGIHKINLVVFILLCLRPNPNMFSFFVFSTCS